MSMSHSERKGIINNNNSNKSSALCRSSQPLAGFSSKSTEDQVLFEAIRNSNPESNILYVVDTRPTINALTNRAQGKGYEDTNVYRNVVIQFFDIENIHVVRSSLEKLLKVCCSPTITLENFTSGLDKSGWLKHLRAILEAAYFVAKRLDEGNSVLVHCSDGWDRTAQVCALALIEKEWIQFGYKFTERCGLESDVDPREVSPIFTQFLDCLRHLLEICPSKFEYNVKLLQFLHDQVYSAVYGTFIGSCLLTFGNDLHFLLVESSIKAYILSSVLLCMNRLQVSSITETFKTIWCHCVCLVSCISRKRLTADEISTGIQQAHFAYASLQHLWLRRRDIRLAVDQRACVLFSSSLHPPLWV
ncbi:unnamed protein product [Trichobilharzia regenti]|nr:unnamed protein product [Trichobilharzia regenti]